MQRYRGFTAKTLTLAAKSLTSYLRSSSARRVWKSGVDWERTAKSPPSVGAAPARIVGSRRAANRLALDFGIDVEVGFGVDNFDRGKAGVNQSLLVFFDGDRAGHAADVGQDLLADFGRDWLFERDVADGQSPARLEHSGHFPKDGVFVRGQVDHAIADDAVDRISRERKIIDHGQMELRHWQADLPPPA